MEISLPLHKMYAQLNHERIVEYTLANEHNKWLMNDIIGQTLTIRFENAIYCISCGQKTNKSFNQGFCYSCFQNAPEASPCIIHPELCEAHLNKGRDIEWEQKHHNQPHIVYLSQTSHIKVGVTRDLQIPTRWIDQGAHAALILAEVPYRQLAGEIEVALKSHISDKTNWRAMLQNTFKEEDLIKVKNKMQTLIPENLQTYISNNNDIIKIKFPVLSYPNKVKSLNLDKTPIYKGKLTGIKGQYLLFEDNTVFNIRKFGGYQVTLSV
jgi:hypothetical protein